MRTTILTGMTTQQLQDALSAAQTAYIALAGGSRIETVAYQQGEGRKQVTYTRANMGALSNLIAELQYMLGITRRARRPLRFIFR